MRTKTIGILGCILFVTASACADTGAGRADTLFRAYQDRVYQIRVIEITSGKKASTGSAFGVSTNGLLATNYHVVRQAIHDPRLYRLECVGPDGKTSALRIIDIDVVHDLAIVLRDLSVTECLVLSSASFEKGTTLFALGNPLDLGMAIVEGTYNGLLEKSFYEKILFSGSLNPGMSGGPTINREGEVVGVSVTTMGQQISFLVPVKHLKRLLDRISKVGLDAPVDFHKRIEQQLMDNQDEYMSRLMAAEWPLDSLGAARVPRILSEVLDWWGDTEIDKEALYEHTYATCFSKDDIFLSSSFSTGKVRYRCDWYVSKGLNAPRFYNLLQKEYEGTFKLNSAGKDDVSNFESRTDFVRIAGKDWRVTFCARNYKKYPHLYDVVVNMASMVKPDRALLIGLELSGVSEDTGAAFVRKFMEAIQWQD